MKEKDWLLLVLVVGTFGILNTEMGVIGILPAVAVRYGIDIVTAGLLVSLFALGVAIAGPTMPLLCSRFNRKRVMVWVLAVFTLCNAVSMMAPTFEVLLAARVIPAFFHPVYCALAFSVAASSVAPENAPKAVAKINMGVAAGMVVGVPVSNFLAEQFSLTTALGFFALVTGMALLLTVWLVPDMPVKKAMSYGKQLGVLRRPMVWASIAAVIFLNGSIFGVYNYLAEYLNRVTLADASWSWLLLFLYGVLNVAGSYLGGQLLAARAFLTVRFFPLAVLLLYSLLYFGGGTVVYAMLGLVILWGILGGINGNINQFWLARAVPEAPDFGNGLFLTAANIGCLAGTAVGGFFIRKMGIASVVFAGMLFAATAFLIVTSQRRWEKN